MSQARGPDSISGLYGPDFKGVTRHIYLKIVAIQGKYSHHWKFQSDLVNVSDII